MPAAALVAWHQRALTRRAARQTKRRRALHMPLRPAAELSCTPGRSGPRLAYSQIRRPANFTDYSKAHRYFFFVDSYFNLCNGARSAYFTILRPACFQIYRKASRHIML